MRRASLSAAAVCAALACAADARAVDFLGGGAFPSPVTGGTPMLLSVRADGGGSWRGRVEGVVRCAGRWTYRYDAEVRGRLTEDEFVLRDSADAVDARGRRVRVRFRARGPGGRHRIAARVRVSATGRRDGRQVRCTGLGGRERPLVVRSSRARDDFPQARRLVGVVDSIVVGQIRGAVMLEVDAAARRVRVKFSAAQFCGERRSGHVVHRSEAVPIREGGRFRIVERVRSGSRRIVTTVTGTVGAGTASGRLDVVVTRPGVRCDTGLGVPVSWSAGG